MKPDELGAAVRARRVDDRCPGVLVLHEAEDGLLLRIRLPGGRLTAGQLEAVAELAAGGNGLVEITARANLQVRGLSRQSAAEAATLLAASGLLRSRAHERVRNILASPLAGRHPDAVSPVDGLVEELDARLCGERRLADLPARFLFAVDDGSGVVPAERADVALVARRGRGGFALAVAGAETTIAAPPERAAAAAVEAAHAFLDLRAESGGTAWRVKELPGGAAALVERLGGRTVAGRVRQGKAVVPGVCEQRDGRVAVTALAPLARLGRALLVPLAAALRRDGGELRVSPWRTVSVVDVAAERGEPLARELARLGLVVSPDSGWVGLSACAGTEACTRARVDVRAVAGRRAAVRPAGAPAEHWAGCERRCGSPGRGIAVVALERGFLVEPAGRRVDDLAAALTALAQEAADA